MKAVAGVSVVQINQINSPFELLKCPPLIVPIIDFTSVAKPSGTVPNTKIATMSHAGWPLPAIYTPRNISLITISYLDGVGETQCNIRVEQAEPQDFGKTLGA